MFYLISKDPHADFITRLIAQECVEQLRGNSLFASMRTLLYDEFGRPLPRVTQDAKIGDTIHVQKPQRFFGRAE